MINSILLFLFSDFKPGSKITLTAEQVCELKKYIIELNRQAKNKTLIRVK